jgi:hypothetical protein
MVILSPIAPPSVPVLAGEVVATRSRRASSRLPPRVADCESCGRAMEPRDSKAKVMCNVCSYRASKKSGEAR